MSASVPMDPVAGTVPMALLSESASITNQQQPHPKNVGILAMEVYVPSIYIDQCELEKQMGVPEGKFTIGLGQKALAVTADTEDINSICLTVVHSLLEKYNIDPRQVGRLEVGTETLIDKSKSTKTVLMDLFADNSDLEGATVINACYGGTAALLNAFLWCESDGWDGRYAIVVAADIADYARGPARPTSGAGAVAVLVGRDAPLVFDPRLRATHASHVWDFYKPDHTVEYPTVDGALSQVCYYQALEDVYHRFQAKMESHTGTAFTAETPDYWVFHSPYNKLVQKSFGRLFFCDERRRHSNKVPLEEEKKDAAQEEYALNPNGTHHRIEEEWLTKPIDETYQDKDLEQALKKQSGHAYAEKLADANLASQLVGNTYTASVFLGLASLVDRVGGRGDLLPGKSIALFSYGSGALATMYQLQVRTPAAPQSRFTIDRMVLAMDLTNRLSQREKIHANELDYALETRARMHHAGAPYQPIYPTVGRMFPGTYFLARIDEQWRRTYARVPLDAPMNVLQGLPLAPEEAVRLVFKSGGNEVPATLLSSDERENEKISCVITGTAAGLPGSAQVFQSDNLDRLLSGKQCITAIQESVMEAMLDKNIVQVKKLQDKTSKRIPLDTREQMIQLSAQLGSFSLTESYGVPPALATTMDTAAQVAVAAGMEALKNAGLVSGKSNDPKEWVLPEVYRDSTGVVYASSFPAMDAAVGEVMRYLQSKTVGAANSMRLISALRDRVLRASPDQCLNDDDEAAFARLLLRAQQLDDDLCGRGKSYEFDRKFLFRVLVLGNAQLAQLAGCRGPNVQTNGACAGTTQAIGIAQDIIMAGRAERVVVIAGDNASGEVLMPWLGAGFRALGAATTKGEVDMAALPFDKRRSGMIMGAGGVGLVIETEKSVIQRQKLRPELSFTVKARLLGTHYSNSAYHGAALDSVHIGSELTRFLNAIEMQHGITKEDIATRGVYFSHETCTHASPASSCAANEVSALRYALGEELVSRLLMLNTKGFTGHPMGTSFEDVTAVECLLKQRVPPMANYQEKDDYLGNLKIIPKGGPHECRYALRFAAGFGSQVAFALYATATNPEG